MSNAVFYPILIIGVIALVVFGLVRIFGDSELDFDENIMSGVSIALCHICGSVAATVVLCLYSAKASLACGIVFTALSGVLMIVVCCLDKNMTSLRLSISIMATADFCCAIAGFAHINNFLALGFSCTALFVVAVVNFLGTVFVHKYPFRNEGLPIILNIFNIFFILFTAASLLSGYIIYALGKKDISVSINSSLYKFDSVNTEIGEKINEDDCLYFNEYYAFQIDFKFSNLNALAAGSRNISIEVTFPSEIINYMSDGAAFTAGKNKDGWKYNFELNTKSSKLLKSGYFVFNYSSDSFEELLPSVNTKVRCSNSEAGSNSFEDTHFLRYAMREYAFDRSYIVDDLSEAGSGRFRITVPEGCPSFEITLYNSLKSGVYCNETFDLPEKYYSFDVSEMLLKSVSESVYNEIISGKETLIIKIVAVGNGNYADTSVEFEYSFD